MDNDFLVNFDNTHNDEQWENAYNTYIGNIEIFKKIIRNMMKKYNIEFITARDSILYELVFLQGNINNNKNFKSKNYIKWVFIYILTMFALIFNSIISFFVSFFEKKENKQILFEELWDESSLYSRYYKYIINQLPNIKNYSLLYNTPSVLIKNIFSKNIKDYKHNVINRRYRNILYSFKISIKVLFVDSFYFIKLYRYSKKNNVNVIYLYLRFLRKLLTYSSQVSNVNANMIVSASDYYWNPIKYFSYKKTINTIILLQHNFKSTKMWNRLFEYCDIHFTHSEEASSKIVGVNFSQKISVGSFQLIPFVEKKKIEYDILFINQTVHDNLLLSTPTLNQKKLIEQHDILIDNFKRYLLKYKNINAVFIAKGSNTDNGYMIKKPAIDIINKYSDLSNIDFIASYGAETFDLVQKSKLIINMYSSVGFEAYGLDKKILWINYNRCCDVMGFDVEQEDLHILINDTSYESFEERVNLLLSDNKEVDEHYKKLKEKYMNIQGNPAKIVADKINEILEKKDENKNFGLYS